MRKMMSNNRASVLKRGSKNRGIKMMLLTKENLKALPPIGSQDAKGMEAIAHVKLFTPDSSWTWYLTEYDPKTGEAFGLVDGLEEELGYISIPELMTVRGKMGLPVERDRGWAPRRLGDCYKVKQ